IRAAGPGPIGGASPRSRIIGAQGPGIVFRAENSAQTEIAPAARSQGRGVLHRQRTASLLTRDAIAVMHVNLTVKMSAAAFELLASRRVQTRAGSKPLRSQ